MMNSKMMYGCCRYLNEIAERYKIHIVRVLGHMGISGNCKSWWTYQAGPELFDEFSDLGIPTKAWKLIIDKAIVDSVNERWAALDTSKTAR